MTTNTNQPEMPTFTARSPEDLMAVVPCVLGFHPEESLVMLTFGQTGRSFHARIDLPDDPGQLPELCEALLAPAIQHRVDKVVFVAYSSDPLQGAAVALLVSDVFVEEGFAVMAPLRSDGSSWFHVRADEDPSDAEPHPYDVTSHELMATAVLAGRVTHPTRDALAHTLRPDPVAVGRVLAAIDARAQRPQRARRGRAEQDWAARLVRTHVTAGSEPTDEEVARLVTSCEDVLVRDAALFEVTRATAEGHVQLWSSVLRRTPDTWVAAPAAVLAFSAWLAGHGALAWCGVDRSREADPGYNLARCVEDLLVRAVPPGAWGRLASAQA